MKFYRLYREKGLIIFNSFVGGEKYWISYQAAAHGGGAMYDQIDELQFESVVNNRVSIDDLYRGLKPRAYNYSIEKAQEEKYAFNEAMDIHNLKQYLRQKIVNSQIEI